MNKSENIQNLALAVVAFQKELQPVQKDATNPFYKSKYATLEAVWYVVGPLLSKNGLAVLQVGAKELGIETILIHESGEWLSGIYSLNEKQDPQGTGSAITYARRYWLSALLGVVVEDDDGEAAQVRNQTTAVSTPNSSQTIKFKSTHPLLVSGSKLDRSNGYPANFTISFGKYSGLSLSAIPLEELKNYVNWLKQQPKKSDDGEKRKLELLNAADQYIADVLSAEAQMATPPPSGWMNQITDEDVPF